MKLLSKNPISPFAYQEILLIKRVFLSKVFLLGVLLRVLIVIFQPSFIQKDYFLPFITSKLHPVIDPWSNFLLDTNYDLAAFPYGIITYSYYKALTLFSYIFALPPFNLDESVLSYYSFNLGTIFLDILTLLSIHLLIPIGTTSSKKITFLYWLSPITIYALYIHGQIDILPLFILLASLVSLRFWRFTLSGVLMAAAISCKFSAAFCLPFYYIFLRKSSFYSRHLPKIQLGFLVTILLLFVSYSLFSGGFQEMVLSTPVSQRLFDLSIVQKLGIAQINFFVLPFSYIFIVYYFYQLERINWGLFLCFSSLSLYALAVFVFPSPGWFVWVVPFAAIYILASEGFSSKLYWLSSISCTLYFVVFDIITFTASREINNLMLSLLYTIMQSLMILQLFNIYKNGIKSDNLYKQLPTPFVLTMSGNDYHFNQQFSDSFAHLLTATNPLHLDIYQYSKFKTSTFSAEEKITPKLFDINNRFNYYFSRFLSDLYRAKASLLPSSISSNSPISYVYSNSMKSVKFISSQIPLSFSSNDLILSISDLNIVISFESDSPPNPLHIDRVSNADIIFTLGGPVQSDSININCTTLPYVKLKARIKNFYFQDLIQKNLLSTCGLNVVINYSDVMDYVEMSFEGDCSKSDLILVLRNCLPFIENLISDIDAFESGRKGLMQLLIIMTLASRHSLSNSQNLS